MAGEIRCHFGRRPYILDLLPLVKSRGRLLRYTLPALCLQIPTAGGFGVGQKGAPAVLCRCDILRYDQTCPRLLRCRSTERSVEICRLYTLSSKRYRRACTAIYGCAGIIERMRSCDENWTGLFLNRSRILDDSNGANVSYTLPSSCPRTREACVFGGIKITCRHGRMAKRLELGIARGCVSWSLAAQSRHCNPEFRKLCRRNGVVSVSRSGMASPAELHCMIKPTRSPTRSLLEPATAF